MLKNVEVDFLYSAIFFLKFWKLTRAFLETPG